MVTSLREKKKMDKQDGAARYLDAMECMSFVRVVWVDDARLLFCPVSE